MCDANYKTNFPRMGTMKTTHGYQLSRRNIGTPLRCTTSEDRGHVWTSKHVQDNYGYFGVKGTSLRKACPSVKHVESPPASCGGKLQDIKLSAEGNSGTRSDRSLNGVFRTIKGLDKSAQNAKGKACLKLVLARSVRTVSQPRRDQLNFDADYINFDSDMFSCYLGEEAGKELKDSSALPVDLRSGVKLGKCHLRSKYAHLGAPADGFVSYGRSLK